MIYTRAVTEGKFLRRPNRFIADVEINGKIQTVHVKNTGRCKELLVPGVKVYLEDFRNVKNLKNPRKTDFDLIAVEKQTKNGKILINMDSQAPNKAVLEWLNAGKFKNELPPHSEITLIKPEYSLGDSRFDFYIEYKTEINNSAGEKIFESHRLLMEVKGVTLEENGHALFPDAPTERGVKHLTELSAFSGSKEYECAVFFVIQMKGCCSFGANRNTHPEFADALKNAYEAGVKILAYDCSVTASSMMIESKIPEILIDYR